MKHNFELELNWVSLAGIWVINYLKLHGRERREAFELLKRLGSDFFLFIYVFAEKLDLTYDGVRGVINFFRFRYDIVLDKVEIDLKGFEGVVEIDKQRSKIIVEID